MQLVLITKVNMAVVTLVDKARPTKVGHTVAVKPLITIVDISLDQ